MESLGPPPGLESLGPPPGLECQACVDDDGESQQDAPWTIPTRSLASSCAVTEPALFHDGVPALVGTSTSWCRHCFSGHDRATLQSVEERLHCEVREAIRLLLDLAHSVALSTTGTAPSSGSGAFRPQQQRSMDGKERCAQGTTVELTGSVLEQHRSALAMQAQELNNAVASDSWASLAAEAANTIVLIHSIAGCGDGPRRAVGVLMQPLQNALVLAMSLGLTDADFALLQSQGLTLPLKTQVVSLFHQALKEPTEEEMEKLISRLGVAKYHLFNDGMKFSRRGARVKKEKSAEEPKAEPLPVGLIA